MKRLTRVTPDPGCRIDDCPRPHSSRGLCQPHYDEARKKGTHTDYPLVRPPKDPAERFFEKVDVTGPCWEWRGGVNEQGYGCFYAGPGAPKKDMYAHRWCWEHLVGPIPDGLTLDHLCRNTICVNPDHLEPVTNSENVRRRMFKRTWCASGRHLLEETATVRPTGKRYCAECGRERTRAYYEAHAEERRAYARARSQAIRAGQWAARSAEVA